MKIFSGVQRIFQSERPRSRWFRLLSRVSERFLGYSRAWVVGWPQGFVGKYSRIIGTAFIKVGPKCSIGRFSWIEAISIPLKSTPFLEIGENFSASERFHIACINQISIGNDCLIGSGVHITDHNHGSYKGIMHSRPTDPPIQRPLFSNGPVQIGNQVWIGDNVVIIGPARIGDGAIVGANSVVSGEVPSQSIVVGAPARVVKVFNYGNNRWELPSSQPAPLDVKNFPNVSL
jgi:acetyltransferase-like isoleucine patch superfamily enzyme